MPRVSIIVPNYNYARFLGQRLGSIEAQRYKDCEVILLDDASNDDSMQLLERFAEKHRCRLVRKEQNSGSASWTLRPEGHAGTDAAHAGAPRSCSHRSTPTDGAGPGAPLFRKP